MEHAVLELERVDKPKKGEDRVFEFVASSDVTDRMRDVVLQNWDLKAFRKNPVFLNGHSRREPPIGKVVKIWKEDDPSGRKVLGKTAQRTKIQVKFVPEDIYPIAGVFEKMYERGDMNAVSVGFRPTKFREVSAEERNELGMGAFGYLIERSELLEVSAVTVPANPEAIQTTVTRTFMDSKEDPEYIRKGIDYDKVEKWLSEVEAIIETEEEETKDVTSKEEGLSFDSKVKTLTYVTAVRSNEYEEPTVTGSILLEGVNVEVRCTPDGKIMELGFPAGTKEDAVSSILDKYGKGLASTTALSMTGTGVLLDSGSSVPGMKELTEGLSALVEELRASREAEKDTQSSADWAHLLGKQEDKSDGSEDDSEGEADPELMETLKQLSAELKDK